ncbi:MAG: stage III sporulation protein AE, partial [Bacillota bacterium]|nr:stage III sporulation protein AE [Bacillota bacterium]
MRKSNYKKLIIAFLLIIILLQIFLILPAHADTVSEATDDELRQQILDQQSNSEEVKKIEDEMNKYKNGSIDQIIPDYDPEKIINDTKAGKASYGVTGVINKALSYLFKEVYQNIDILIKLIVLVILCAVLKNLQTSFLSDSVGEVAFYACYAVIVGVLMLSFNTAMILGKSIIDDMVDFMHASIPVLVTLLLSGGSVASAGIFQPVLILIVQVTATVVKNVFIPLIFLSTVLSVVNNISEKIQIAKLAGLFKQITAWAVGITLTIFIGIVSVQGSLGAVVDGVAGKTAKFALSTFVPVVGKYLSDAADAVVGCTLIIKNASGVAIMIGVIAICLVPLLKILALVLLYRATCALIEPISDKRITNCMNDMASSLTYILGIAAAVAFMFLISITVLISAGNMTA